MIPKYGLYTSSFQTTTRDPTKSFQSQIRKVMTDSKTLIPPDTKWKYINMIPTAPSIKGLIKLRKPHHPVRPVVNWWGVPAYKSAGLFTQKIRQLTPVPNTYNLENNTDLIKKLMDTPFTSPLRPCLTGHHEPLHKYSNYWKPWGHTQHPRE